MVFEEDEKVLQTGQTIEVIASAKVVEFDAISSVELGLLMLLNFTINLHFLIEDGVLFSILDGTRWPPTTSTSTDVSNGLAVSVAELDVLLVGTDSISA